MRFFLLAIVFVVGGNIVVGLLAGVYRVIFHLTRLTPDFYLWGNAFIAGPAAEGARYIGYRRRPTASWSEGVMYGLGHGALESMLFKATCGLGNSNPCIFSKVAT